jgi:hypothetical protein
MNISLGDAQRAIQETIEGVPDRPYTAFRLLLFFGPKRVGVTYTGEVERRMPVLPDLPDETLHGKGPVGLWGRPLYTLANP